MLPAELGQRLIRDSAVFPHKPSRLNPCFHLGLADVEVTNKILGLVAAEECRIKTQAPNSCENRLGRAPQPTSDCIQTTIGQFSKCLVERLVPAACGCGAVVRNSESLRSPG